MNRRRFRQSGAGGIAAAAAGGGRIRTGIPGLAEAA